MISSSPMNTTTIKLDYLPIVSLEKTNIRQHRALAMKNNNRD